MAAGGESSRRPFSLVGAGRFRWWVPTRCRAAHVLPAWRRSACRAIL